jgi:hypothetical protein
VFWKLYADKSADLIAARLGVEPDTIRRHRLWYKEGRFKCKECSNCVPVRFGIAP